MYHKYASKQLTIYLIYIFLAVLASINIVNLITANNVFDNSGKVNVQKRSQVPTKDEKEIIYDKPYYDLIVENYPGGKIYKKFLDGHIEIVNE